MARYRCSGCKGTLEIGMGQAATCPLDDGDLTAEASTAPATGCLRSLESFRDRTFSWPHYVPGSGRGKFDCSYDPKQGNLDITVRFGAEFQSGWTDWFGSTEKANLIRDFSQSIPTYWNGKYVLRCTKPGWTTLTVSPRFKVTFGEVLGAHFRMVISREDTRTSAHGRECRGFVSLNQVKSGDPYKAQDRIELRDFQVADFNHSVGGLQRAGNDREFIETCLRDAGVANAKQDRSVDTQGRIETFKVTVGLLDFADNSADTAGFAASLRSFVTRVRGQMKGSMPVPLQIKGYSKPSETDAARIAGDRATAVQAILTTATFPNPIKVVAAGSGQARVEIWPDLDYEWSFKRGEKTYDYNVGAHEFGHLLGLPDEYENPVAGAKKDPDNDAKATVKTNFLKLCGDAGVRPPTFPSHTPSMMSDGMTIMQWHMVTVWEALANMTSAYIDPSEWTIMGAG